MKVGQLLEHLDSRFPLDAAPAWDPVGIQIGGPDRDLGSVGVCHEVTEHIVDLVQDRPLATLVAYHPLLFSPVTRLIDGPTAEGRALRLAASGTSLIVVHTALDLAHPGTGAAALEALGFEVVGSFGGDDDHPPIGRLARLSDPWTTTDLVVHIEARFGIVPRVADAGLPIERVGLLPGSGGAFLHSAVGAADAVITGDVSHHRAVAARDAGLTVLDVGHSASERAGVESLYAAVRAVVPEAVYLDDDPTPWG